MKQTRSILLIIIFLLSGCGKQAQTALAPATEIRLATETGNPATTMSVPPMAAPSPVTTPDPTIFGAIGMNEIQASTFESVADTIFKKTMAGFIASGSVQEYQITSVTISIGDEVLLAEIIYNVRTGDTTWLADGGIQAADGWINGNCSRFDFFVTETEFQLKNRRLCN